MSYDFPCKLPVAPVELCHGCNHEASPTGVTKLAKKNGNLKAKAKATPKHEPEVAQANAKAKATRAKTVAAVTQVVASKNVRVASNASGVRPEFNPAARIVVLPAGKENPRREGTARWKRYEEYPE